MHIIISFILSFMASIFCNAIQINNKWLQTKIRKKNAFLFVEVMAVSVSMVRKRQTYFETGRIATFYTMRCQRQGEFIKQKSQQQQTRSRNKKRKNTHTDTQILRYYICVLSIVNEQAAVALVCRALYARLLARLTLNVTHFHSAVASRTHTHEYAMPYANFTTTKPSNRFSVVSFLVIG